jgi:hypothetical protein
LRPSPATIGEEDLETEAWLGQFKMARRTSPRERSKTYLTVLFLAWTPVQTCSGKISQRGRRRCGKQGPRRAALDDGKALGLSQTVTWGGERGSLGFDLKRGILVPAWRDGEQQTFGRRFSALLQQRGNIRKGWWLEGPVL